MIRPAELDDQIPLAVQLVLGRARPAVGRGDVHPEQLAVHPPGHATSSPDEAIAPGAPLMATTTRSRVSHVSVMPWSSR